MQDTFKAANVDKKDQLYNNFLIHYEVQDAFAKASHESKPDINLPRLGSWQTSNNAGFWKRHTNCFPAGFQSTYGFVSERIHPVQASTREAMFDAFASKSARSEKQAFLSNPENQDCLLRLYLGRREVPRSTFHLRNFDLMVDEMEWLHLDTRKYAKVMAKTLAFLHWKVKIDGNDVEFVLGRCATKKMLVTLKECQQWDLDAKGHQGPQGDFGGCPLGIWLLDFDQCHKFRENAAGLKQLERAFFSNDPYYPRPCAKNPKDQQLWEDFRSTYLAASKRLTEIEMPTEFIDAVERECARRAASGSIFT